MRLIAVLLVAIAPVLSGCTLVGAGIGAVTPAYSYEDVTGIPGRPDLEDTVEIHSRRGKTRGRFEGVLKTETCASTSGTGETCPDYKVVVQTHSGQVLIPAEEVTAVRRRREDGTSVMRGATIGAIIDLSLVAFTLYFQRLPINIK